MFRTIAVIAGFTALATTAQAAEAKLSLAGKDAATVHAEIVHAARKVCGVAYRGDSLSSYLIPSCVQDTVDVTVAKVGDANLVAFNQAHPLTGRVDAMKLAAR